MPSKINTVIAKTTASINNLKKEISALTTILETLKNNQDNLEGKINKDKQFKQRKYGLIDLIRNKTPILSGWTNNPTDTQNITNKSIDWCSTGDKTTGGADEYGYMEWDLGDFYYVILTGMGRCDVIAGSGYVKSYFWNGTSWQYGGQLTSSSTLIPWDSKGILCSKFRLAFSSSIATTLAPHIRELCIWRLD